MTERLSSVDAAFLAQDRPAYVISGVRLLVFSGPAPGFETFLEHVRDRLPLVPRLRQRVRRSPLDLRRPSWEQDPEFGIEHHVRPMPLPPAEPGSELEALCEELLSRPLDLRRPLWELWYVEGLPGGRFVAGSRFHHALGDGSSTAHVLVQLFPPAQDAIRHAPGEAGSVRDERARVRESGRPEAGAADARRAPGSWRSPAPLSPRRVAQGVRRDARRRARRLARPITQPRRRGSSRESALIGSAVGHDRSVRLVSAPLADLRLARTALGTTTNNVVIAAVAGALRRHLVRRDEAPVDLIAMIPVSIRKPGDLELGNRVRTLLCDLPVSEPDPGARLRLVTEAVSAAAARRRAAGEHRGVPRPQVFNDYLVRRRSGSAYRLFDVVITSTRRSTAPLRCCGREAELSIPGGPNIPFHGPLFMVWRYLGATTISITTDPAAMPDGGTLAVDLRDGLDELQALARASAGSADQPSGKGWIGTPWSRSRMPSS